MKRTESSHYSYMRASSFAVVLTLKSAKDLVRLTPSTTSGVKYAYDALPPLITRTSRDVESDVGDNNFSNRQFLQRSRLFTPFFSVNYSPISRIRDEISEVASVCLTGSVVFRIICRCRSSMNAKIRQI